MTHYLLWSQSPSIFHFKLFFLSYLRNEKKKVPSPPQIVSGPSLQHAELSFEATLSMAIWIFTEILSTSNRYRLSQPNHHHHHHTLHLKKKGVLVNFNRFFFEIAHISSQRFSLSVLFNRVHLHKILCHGTCGCCSCITPHPISSLRWILWNILEGAPFTRHYQKAEKNTPSTHHQRRHNPRTISITALKQKKKFKSKKKKSKGKSERKKT